jgi:hypothetical protein
MVATVNLLRFGRTLSPASAIVMPWTMTWSMTVARISSVMMVRGCLALPPGPSLPCWPAPLPPWPAPLPPWPEYEQSSFATCVLARKNVLRFM